MDVELEVLWPLKANCRFFESRAKNPVLSIKQEDRVASLGQGYRILKGAEFNTAGGIERNRLSDDSQSSSRALRKARARVIARLNHRNRSLQSDLVVISR